MPGPQGFTEVTPPNDPAERYRAIPLEPTAAPDGHRFSEASPTTGRSNRQQMFRVEAIENNASRRPKTPTVVEGPFSPLDFPGHGPGKRESTQLAGGPFDGQVGLVARSAAEYSRPAAGPDGGYTPVIYDRTARRSDDGNVVFEHRA